MLRNIKCELMVEITHYAAILSGDDAMKQLWRHVASMAKYMWSWRFEVVMGNESNVLTCNNNAFYLNAVSKI